MASDLAREALAPEGVLPLRVNEMTPSVIICAEGSRISIQWREQRPDQPDHDEYGRAEAMAAFLVEAANRHGAAYDAIGSRVKALEWNEITAARSDEDPSHEPTGDYEAVTGIGIYYVECGFGTDSYVFSACLNGDHISSHDDPDEAKAAAQADFERRVLSCLSTHTAAGAGPVGEAVTTEMVNAAWNEGKHRSMRGSTNDFRRVLEVALSTRTIVEPGEIDRLTRERDEARAKLAAYQKMQEHEAFKGLMTGPDPARVWKQQAVQFAHNLDAAEAALAKTRERLEKREAALREIASLEEYDVWTANGHAKCNRIARAALTGDAQEAGR